MEPILSVLNIEIDRVKGMRKIRKLTTWGGGGGRKLAIVRGSAVAVG